VHNWLFTGHSRITRVDWLNQEFSFSISITNQICEKILKVQFTPPLDLDLNLILHHRSKFRAGKVENWPWMTQFSNRKNTHVVWVQFLSISVNTTKKCIGRILAIFSGLDTTREGPEQAKLKFGLGWLSLDSKYTTMFGVQFLSFLVSMAEKEICWIFTTFLGPNTTRASKVENQAPMAQFCTRNICALFGLQLLSFSVSTTEKYFSQILTTFSGSKTTGVGKVGNRVRMARFCTRNISRLFGVQLLSFLVNTAENFFGQCLMTFSAPDTTGAGSEQAKLKIRSGWLGFEFEKYHHCLGAILIDFSHYSWKIFWSNFYMSGPIHSGAGLE